MKTLIVGGGLSGLAVARALDANGSDYTLVEARSRFGGRIKTERHDGGYYDMGPAWFWPGQPRIAALTESLGIEKFEQFADGILTFEDEQEHVQHGRGFSSMEGSWRLAGGFGALTQTLAETIPESRKRLNAPVQSLLNTADGITAILGDREAITADQVVFALPPRVAGEIEFSPALPSSALQAIQGIPTWMAGQAKAIAVYDTPFWRDAGLSGDAMSRRGPMIEIHDASPASGGPFALFGFIGVAPQGRRDEKALRQQVLAQFVRLFGHAATAPSRLFIKDWAFDPYTSTTADLAPLYAHPTYTLPQALRGLWNNKIYFAGTEVAPEFGGYIEGALEAAANVVAVLQG
jgi:monoamine oxidase